MAGTILVAGVVACTAALTVGLVGAGAAAGFSQRLAGTADAAALAAADTSSGVVAGDPCTRAAEVAAAGDAMIVSCDVNELIATVKVSATFARLVASATARAGPPPSPDPSSQ